MMKGPITHNGIYRSGISRNSKLSNIVTTVPYYDDVVR